MTNEKKIDNNSKNRILVISSVIPEKSGAVTRLFYDILCANQDFGNKRIDVSISMVEKRPENLPTSYNFIPWSEILYQGNLITNKIFTGVKVRRDWRKYSRVHINAIEYDAIVSYPFGMAALDYVGFKGKHFALSIDSSSMVFARATIKHTNIVLKVASIIRLVQNGWIDWKVSREADYIYLVGKSDVMAYNVFFNRSKNVIYIPHTVMPEIRDIDEMTCWDGSSKIKLLFAGSLSEFYTGTLMKDYIDAISKSDLQDKICIYFLGSNKYAKALLRNGFDVTSIDYVPDFESFLITMHIMLVPLLVGGGTKNRILSALGCGMDVIGSSVACENIYGITDKNIADDGGELIKKLSIRLENKKLYQILGKEREQFFSEHSLENWEENLWKRIKPIGVVD